MSCLLPGLAGLLREGAPVDVLGEESMIVGRRDGKFEFAPHLSARARASLDLRPPDLLVQRPAGMQIAASWLAERYVGVSIFGALWSRGAGGTWCVTWADRHDRVGVLRAGAVASSSVDIVCPELAQLDPKERYEWLAPKALRAVCLQAARDWHNDIPPDPIPVAQAPLTGTHVADDADVRRAKLALDLRPDLVARFLRIVDADARTTQVLDPASAAALLAPFFDGLENEELHALFLSTPGKLITHRRLTTGSTGFTVVDPRQIFRAALDAGAASVILAHNHPAGDPTPREQDVAATRSVSRAGHLLGIPLQDHIVFAGGTWVSMVDSGMMEPADTGLPGFVVGYDRPLRAPKRVR